MAKINSPTREEISKALSSRILELIILPTEDCNFRCTYCYEVHVPGRMQQGTVDGIKKLIERRVGDLEFLRLSWFGGEPLMAKNIVFEVGEFASERCQALGVEFAGDVTTNGYLLSKATMARLAEANHRQYFVSLAGHGDAHDRLRPLASGNGSFEQIWHNLIELRDSSIRFDISLRLHFTPELSSCEELCRRVNEHFGDDERFTVSLQRVADLGGPNTGKFNTMSAEAAQSAIWHLASLIPDVKVTNLYPDKFPICCAARPNNFLIRPDGRVSRCACHLNDTRNFIGTLDANGVIEFDRDQLKPWFKGYDSFDGDMLACPINSVPNDLWPEAATAAVIPIERLTSRGLSATR